MAENTKIQWAHHTFNPWSGCTKVSDGCKNCYAAVNYSVKMRGVKWGPNGNRIIKADSGWKEPLKWDRAAKEAGERHRVFCASLADVFEGDDTMPEDSRAAVKQARLRLWDTIYQTQNLDWLLLTKRPENIIPIIGGESGAGIALFEECMNNVWIGTSVEDQKTANGRIPHLLKCPAVVRFLSIEPLLEPIDLGDCMDEETYGDEGGDGPCNSANWVIIGGESGPGARPCDYRWIKSIVDQCDAAGVSCFVKQLGSVHTLDGFKVPLKDKKGGDISEFPEGLRVRELPNGRK